MAVPRKDDDVVDLVVVDVIQDAVPVCAVPIPGVLGQREIDKRNVGNESSYDVD